ASALPPPPPAPSYAPRPQPSTPASAHPPTTTNATTFRMPRPRSPGPRDPGVLRRRLYAEVEEPVGLVTHLETGLAQGDVPVAPAIRVVLLHPVIGDEHERGLVEDAGPLDRREDLPDARVAVAHRC